MTSCFLAIFSKSKCNQPVYWRPLLCRCSYRLFSHVVPTNLAVMPPCLMRTQLHLWMRMTDSLQKRPCVPKLASAVLLNCVIVAKSFETDKLVFTEFAALLFLDLSVRWFFLNTSAVCPCMLPVIFCSKSWLMANHSCIISAWHLSEYVGFCLSNHLELTTSSQWG